MEELVSKKRARDDPSESELDSPEVKKLREDLLDSPDDSSDLCTVTPDLDSFMKSFEEEISASPSSLANEPASESGESHSNLGYLLEASDDELGLPPSTTTSSGEVGGSEMTELVRVSSDTSAELSELWRFDDQIPSYDSFDFGIPGNEDNGINGEYVALDGLFDYSDFGPGSYDAPVPLWRPETAPAQ